MAALGSSRSASTPPATASTATTASTRAGRRADARTILSNPVISIEGKRLSAP